MASPPSNQVDLAFRAFSDPSRLRILHLLQAGELCVCDLVEVLRLPQPTVSRHLAYLRKAHLVSTRIDGPWSFYRLTPAATPFHHKLLECLGACFSDVPALASDRERVKTLHQRGDCCTADDRCRS